MTELPPPTTELMPGVYWGCASELFTPAFWKYQVRAARHRVSPASFNIGRTLQEEIAVCLLGGHGLPAELGLAAFHRLRDRQLLRAEVERDELEKALSEPLSYGGRTRRYRFPRQKAKFLWHALQIADDVSERMSPRQFRDHLTNVPGIGPKTASWIVRNHFGSDEVAILDVHILRAGSIMGIFPASPDPSRMYSALEEMFLAFCRKIEEPASLVDALMWEYMRRIGPTATIKLRQAQRELALVQ